MEVAFKMFGYSVMISTISTKKDNFCDFLFASLDDSYVAFPNGVYF